MSMIAIQPFDAHFADSKGNRYECQVVGICGEDFNKSFVVISTADDGDEVGTFEVDRVFRRARPAKK